MREIPCQYGTILEIPRAALQAAKMAEVAEFFSFGTNNLTQMTFGFSRTALVARSAPFLFCESRYQPVSSGARVSKQSPSDWQGSASDEC
jgi:phosphoenolpyruvate synthase/pyruvate phosphate dikinase